MIGVPDAHRFLGVGQATVSCLAVSCLARVFVPRAALVTVVGELGCSRHRGWGVAGRPPVS